MKLTKREVQKRVLKDGKPLGLKLFEWNIRTRTFKSGVDGLVIDFTDINNVSFDTKHDCTFVTGSECTFTTGTGCRFYTEFYCKFTTGSFCMFNTGGHCTFETGNNCTFDTSGICVFKTGKNCVFTTFRNCKFVTSDHCTFITNSYCEFKTGNNCIIITNKLDNGNELIKPQSNIKLTTCPENIPGYLIGNDYYVNDVKQEGEYMIADGILSKIISKKGNIFKVYDYTDHLDSFSTTPTYIVQDGDIFAHGETVKEARESLIYKISNRDISVYENLTIDSVLTKEEAIKMYRVITGSCEYGVRNFVESLLEVKDTYTIKEIIELTTGQYGNDVLRKFFKI